MLADLDALLTALFHRRPAYGPSFGIETIEGPRAAAVSFSADRVVACDAAG